MTHCATKLNDQHEGCVYCVCLTGSGRKRSCEEQNTLIKFSECTHGYLTMHLQCTHNVPAMFLQNAKKINDYCLLACIKNDGEQSTPTERSSHQ